MKLVGLLLLCSSTAAAFQPAFQPRVRLGGAVSAQPIRWLAPCRAETVIMGTDVAPQEYKLGAAFLLLGPAILFAPWLFGGFFTLLGLLIAVQTLRVRFVFDEDSFAVSSVDIADAFNADAALKDSGENFAVGGENRWAYSSFVNWEFFPSEDLPILVYFKETQTPADKWDVGPGQWANSEDAKAKGAVPGQVHFFPCIAPASYLKEQFVERGCAKL